MSKSWIGKGVEGSGRRLIWSTSSEFAFGDKENSENPESG
jgi:hypothetical protein